MIGPAAQPLMFAPIDVKNFFPPRTAVILAAIAFVLVTAGIAINYFTAGDIQYVHVLFALGLLAFVVWFSGRRGRAE